MKFTVTRRMEIEADTAEDAAIEADRSGMTTQPRDYTVTAPGPHAGTVFVRVVRGAVARTA